MSTTPPNTTDLTQMLLPGQAAAPDGPIDMTVMYVMHHGFRRDLQRFAAAVPATPVDDHRTWVALATRWQLFADVLHHHHSAEDAGVWPVLLERADGDEAAHLEAMEAEHAHLDPALDAVAAAFTRLTEESAADLRVAHRAALAALIDSARALLSDHLAHEERSAIRIIQRHVTPQEWSAIEREHFGRRPAPAGMAFLVPWFLEDVPVAAAPRHRPQCWRTGRADLAPDPSVLPTRRAPRVHLRGATSGDASIPRRGANPEFALP